MENFFRKLEEVLLSQEVRASKIKLDELLDDNFLEYGTLGKIYDKGIMLERLPLLEFYPVCIQNFEIFHISSNYVQTRFITKEVSERLALRTSIWKKYSEGNWKMIFHQGTPKQVA